MLAVDGGPVYMNGSAGANNWPLKGALYLVVRCVHAENFLATGGKMSGGK